MSHHHHHKHSHKHSSSSSESNTQNLGGLNLGSALQNLNLSSLASSLIGNMDIGQLFGVLSGVSSSPLKNTVSPQQFASPILKKEPTEKEIEITQEEENQEDKKAEFNTTDESIPPKEEPIITPEAVQDLKFDPEKLSGMLNNLVNILSSQPESPQSK